MRAFPGSERVSPKNQGYASYRQMEKNQKKANGRSITRPAYIPPRPLCIEFLTRGTRMDHVDPIVLGTTSSEPRGSWSIWSILSCTSRMCLRTFTTEPLYERVNSNQREQPPPF